MSDWALVATAALLVIYRLAQDWMSARRGEDAGETPPPGNDTLVETPYREPAREDGERRIPDIRLGFQRE